MASGKDNWNVEQCRRIALYNLANGGGDKNRLSDPMGTDEPEDNDIDEFGKIREKITPTFYNVMYSEDFYGGTDCSSEGYGTYKAALPGDTWNGTGMYGISSGKVYVRNLDTYMLSFVKDGNKVEYNGEVVTLEWTVRDYVFDGTYLYSLIIDSGVYKIALMSNPETIASVIYSQETEITWIATNGSSVVFTDGNRVYAVTDTVTAASIYDPLSNYGLKKGIVKLISNGEEYIVIGHKGTWAYSKTTDDAVWYTRREGNYDFVDVDADGNSFYLINRDGQVYYGNKGFAREKSFMFMKFKMNPISVNKCGVYMIVTYPGMIQYALISKTLKFKDFAGYEESKAIRRIYYFNGYYHVLYEDPSYGVYNLKRGTSMDSLSNYMAGICCMTMNKAGTKLYIAQLTGDSSASVKYIDTAGTVTTISSAPSHRMDDVWETANGDIYCFSMYTYRGYKWDSANSSWTEVMECTAYEPSYHDSIYNPANDEWRVDWRTGWYTYNWVDGKITEGTWSQFWARGRYYRMKPVETGVLCYLYEQNVTKYIYDAVFRSGSSETQIATPVLVCAMNYIDGLYIMAGANGAIYISPNLANWVKVYKDSNYFITNSKTNMISYRDSNQINDIFVANGKVFVELFDRSTWKYKMIMSEG